MARHIETREIIFDDLDGSEGASELRFSLEGVDYRLDLTDEHRADFYRALSPFLNVAQREQDALPLELPAGSRTPAPVQTARNIAVSDDVIAWAQAHGYPYRGNRAPAHVLEAYEAAHLSQVAPPVSARSRAARSRTFGQDTVRTAAAGPAVRSWARHHGYPVTDERVPLYVLDAYRKAHPTRGDRTPTRSQHSPVAVPVRVVERNVSAPPEVLEWALQHGHEVRNGRVSSSVLADYQLQQGHDAGDDDVILDVEIVTDEEGLGETSSSQDADDVEDAEIVEFEQPLVLESSESAANFIEQPLQVADLEDEDDVLSEMEADEAKRQADHFAEHAEYSLVHAGEPARKRVYKPGRNHNRIYPVGIREWARAKGFRVGRATIKQEVLDAFYAAHPEQSPAS